MAIYVKSTILLLMLIILASSTIYLGSLENYADQEIPEYITQDNTEDNTINDLEATLGRVLFYDKQMSIDKSIACASCHIQQFAFGDTSLVSTGVNGVTGRHSMRLINSRFADEERFFWDERAATLEEQTTMPIQDHAEMGYSGENGAPTLDDLILELNQLPYYQELCFAINGDPELDESRMQNAIAQFIRSIQSFDSKYDDGRAQVDNESVSFPNFTPSENRGKALYLGDPIFGNEGNRIDGGIGCASCHGPPEFAIDPVTRNNGVIIEVNGSQNFEIKKAPTLRDLFNPEGEINGPMMHNGQFATLGEVLNHYNTIGFLPMSTVTQVDPRLRSEQFGQKLNLTPSERVDIRNFLLTLTGSNVYTDPRWSDPFDPNGDIEVIDGVTSTHNHTQPTFSMSPNPASDDVNVYSDTPYDSIEIYNESGQRVASFKSNGSDNNNLDISHLQGGIYFVRLMSGDTSRVSKLMISK